MKLSTICCFLLAATFSASGQSADSNRTLNLRGLQFQTAHASGSSLFLTVTGQPPEWDALFKPQPKPLKRRDPAEVRGKVQVAFGRDVIGFALVSGVFRETIPTSTASKEPKMKVTAYSGPIRTAIPIQIGH